MSELLTLIELSALGRAMRGTLWLYPLVNVLHVLGAASLFGLLLATELRLLGAAATIPADALMRLTLPLVWAAFALMVLSGLLLFTAEARVVAANPFFRLKLGLILLAGLNALWLHRRRRRGMSPRPPAALSLAFWTGVLALGRLIAYW